MFIWQGGVDRNLDRTLIKLKKPRFTTSPNGVQTNGWRQPAWLNKELLGNWYRSVVNEHMLGHHETQSQRLQIAWKSLSQCFGFSLILGKFQDLYVNQELPPYPPDSQCDCDSNHSVPLSATNWSACQFTALIVTRGGGMSLAQCRQVHVTWLQTLYQLHTLRLLSAVVERWFKVNWRRNGQGMWGISRQESLRTTKYL